MMNLIKFIAACGAASRRQAEALIRSGKVMLNGEVTLNPASRVSGEDQVVLDGKVLALPERRHYFLLNKPRGYVCSNADTHGEKLAVSLFAMPHLHLVSAGRLDKESEGAIIFSDDGEFINRLAHPRYGILKHYLVETDKPLPAEALKKMPAGITDDGEILRVISIKALAPRRYEVVLNEGKKREIRRLTAFFGCVTKRLQRVSVGSVELGRLPVGTFRELTGDEISGLLSATFRDE